MGTPFPMEKEKSQQPEQVQKWEETQVLYKQRQSLRRVHPKLWPFLTLIAIYSFLPVEVILIFQALFLDSSFLDRITHCLFLLNFSLLLVNRNVAGSFLYTDSTHRNLAPCLLSCCLVRLFPIPRTVARQAPLSVGLSRQKFWSGLPFASPEDLPNPGIKPASPALQADSLPLNHQGSSDQRLTGSKRQ